MNQVSSVITTAKKVSFYAVEFTLLCGGVYLLAAANAPAQLPFIG